MIGKVMDATGVSNQYQVTTAAKQIWDRSLVPTFYGNGTPIAASSVLAYDYLFGKVTFTGAQSTPITMDGKYMPMTLIGGAHGYSITQTADMLDDTDFEDDGVRSRKYGILDASASLESWDIDEEALAVAMAAREALVLEIRPGGDSGTAPICRGWFLVENESNSGGVADLAGKAIGFQLSGAAEASISWSDL